MPRCFIAFPVGGEAKKEMERVQEEIRRHDLKAPIKFVVPDNFHVTVEFLGELDNKQVMAVENILAAVASDHRVFNYELMDFAAYPDFSKPSTLAVQVENKTGEEKSLRDDIREELKEQGLLVNGDFSHEPHLTLARVKAEWNRAAHYRKLPIAKISWSVERIVLFESKINQDGSKYFPLSQYELKK